MKKPVKKLFRQLHGKDYSSISLMDYDIGKGVVKRLSEIDEELETESDPSMIVNCVPSQWEVSSFFDLENDISDTVRSSLISSHMRLAWKQFISSDEKRKTN